MNKLFNNSLFLLILSVTSCAHNVSNFNRVPASPDDAKYFNSAHDNYYYFGSCNTDYIGTSKGISDDNELNDAYLQEVKLKIEKQLSQPTIRIDTVVCSIVAKDGTVKTGRSPVVVLEKDPGIDQIVKASRCITPDSSNGNGENDLAENFVRKTANSMAGDSEIIFFQQLTCNNGRKVVVVMRPSVAGNSEGITTSP